MKTIIVTDRSLPSSPTEVRSSSVRTSAPGAAGSGLNPQGGKLSPRPADGVLNAHAEPRKGGHAARYRQITSILARHGLGFIFGSFELPHPGARTATRGAHHHTRPERLRLAIEELGPTFIKLGQILSSRGDLLPTPYLDELEKLQDGAPPIAAEDVRRIVVGELGRPVEDVFATFDLTPLAAASIGQAHLARLRDGTEVVVKVRRPGVDAQIDEDLRILLDLALRASRHWSAARYYDLYGIAQEFAQTLRTELDYLHEADNAERFYANFADYPDVHIPRVYRETTTERMLTMERIRGIKITDVHALDAARIDRCEVARRAARALLKMILDDGFFHADPHPGNVFVEADGTVALVDFGMVGSVDGPTKDLLVRLVLSMASNDASRLADVLLEMSAARVRVDRNALRRDLQRLLARYLNRPLGDVRLGAMLGELLNIVRWHHLRLPADLALLVKTLGMDDGLGVALDPHFDMMEVYVPYAEDFMRRQFSPRQWLKSFTLLGLDSLQMGLELPQQVRRILGDIERGGVEVSVQPDSFDPFLARFEPLVNRLIVGILAAAFTIGMSLLIAAYRPQIGGVFLVLFLLVLMLSGFFGTYVVVLILLSRRRPR